MQNRFMNCSRLFIEVETVQLFIKGYDKNFVCLFEKKLSFETDFLWFYHVIWQFLNSALLCSYTAFLDRVVVEKMDNTFLTILDKQKSLIPLYNKIQQKYLNDRLSYFEKNVCTIQTIYLLSSSDSLRFDYSQDKTMASFSFVFKEDSIGDLDQEFLKKLLGFMNGNESHSLALYEYFYLKNNQAISLRTFLLKKGTIRIYFNSYFFDFILNWINSYEEVSSEKVIRVLKGPKTGVHSNSTCIREKLRIVKGGLI